MKIWEKGISLDSKVESFTIGRDKEFDISLAAYDVEASLAHVEMLQSIGLLSLDELRMLRHAYSEIDQRIRQQKYIIEEGVEDIHSQIELDLVRQIGDIGKKVHAGRSRNDQVAVCLHLYYRSELKSILSELIKLVDCLLNMAKLHQSKLMPGYTHTQIGMVSSFGLWFSAFAESLVQDHNFLKSISTLIDQNPLGSSAGYGNSLPLDRSQTTKSLGFQNLAVNSIYAQMTRSKSELMISQGMSSIAFTLGKFASDVCLFCGANFNFLSIPDQITTGSSIMPHKKNPDVFELIRAKCNQLMATPNQILLLINNLMTGYHRDVQSLKEIIIPAINMMHQVLDISLTVIPMIEPNPEILEDSKYDHLFTVESVNHLVQKNVPFRDAYMQVADQIATGKFKVNRDLKHTHIGSIGNLAIDDIRLKLHE